LHHDFVSGFERLRRVADSEDAGFYGACAVEAPFVGGDGLGEFLLENADGSKSFDDGLAVFFEGIVLVGGAQVDLAGESVFVGVDAGALLACLGFRPGRAGGLFGELRVVPGDGLGFRLL
jgi:hypothetical protein